MSHQDKKPKKIFSLRESLKDKWRLIYTFFDEKKHEFYDTELITENKDGMIQSLNDFAERIENDIKKKREIDSNEVKAYLVIFYALLIYFPQLPSTTIETYLNKTERFLAPKVPNSIKTFAFEVVIYCVIKPGYETYLSKLLEYIDLNTFSTKILDLPSMPTTEFTFTEEVDEKNQPIIQMKNIECSIAKLNIFFQRLLTDMKSFEILLPTFIQILLLMFPNTAPEITNKLKVFPQVPAKLLLVICENGICKMNANQRLRIIQSCPFFPLILKLILQESFALVLEEPQLLFVIRWFFSFLLDPVNSVTLSKLNGQTKEQFNNLLNSIIKTTESFYILVPLITSYPEVTLTIDGKVIKKDVVEFLNEFLNIFIVPSQTVQIKEQLKLSLQNSLKLYYQRAFEAKKLKYGYVHKRITSITKTLFKTWISWPPNDTAWEELQTIFIPLMAIEGVINVVDSFFTHITICLLNIQYPQKPNDQLFTKTYDNVIEPIIVNEELKQITTPLFKEDIVRIWKYLWKFIDISVDIPNEERAERWHNVMFKSLQIILFYEQRCGPSNFELHDIIVPYLLATASKHHFKENNTSLCQILCRRYPQYTDNINAVLLGYLKNVIQQGDFSILADMYDLFTTSIKGKTSILNDVLISLRCLTIEQSNSMELNQQIRIASLLHSLLFYSKIYPTINTLLSDNMGYQDILTLCYSNLIQIFTSPEIQQTLLWGIIVNLLSACEAKRPNDELRVLCDMFLQKTVHSNLCLCKQAIRSLRIISRCSEIIPNEILTYIAETLLIFISNNTMDDTVIPIALEQLEDFILVPNGVLSQGISAALQSVLVRLSDNTNTYVQQFILLIEHYFNRKIGLPCCDDSFTRDVYFIGRNKVTSENEHSLYIMQNNSIFSFTDNGSNGVDVVVRNLYGTYHWIISSIERTEEVTTKEFNFKPEKLSNENRICPCDGSFEIISSGMNDLGENIEKEMKEELMNIETNALKLNANILKLSNKPIEVETKNMEITSKWDYIQSLELLTNTKDPIIQLTNDKKLKQLLFKLDCLPIRKRYACSLIYFNSDSKMSLFNECSPQFTEFAGSLGYLVSKELFVGNFPKECEKAYYYSDETVEVTFAPSIYFKQSSLNSISTSCVVVWNESELALDTSLFPKPSTIIEIHPRDDGMFVIDMWRNATVPVSVIDLTGPLQTSMVVPKNFLPILVRETVLNICYFNSSSLSQLQLRQYVFSEIGTTSDLVKKAFSSITALELTL
ncbi:hypothetical protein ENUP19_0333G0005 [Entamoeba nuttalli]|uniref:Uncharacterized protein n=2 Tax=Entamoeba nuttalli TaxID=412467 RepID=K2HM48_ENTNP|nr:hypothetical protein ENU1_215640 [Entamoeba nuttalli P19]EKE36875.1 hypothetical protein ENU1_215640 [Entamoeba nuttalli P19]|eukprot:XP_008860795.1 hypothetical protein ENU1_215640 [Entamoeba nuttalli P19]